MLLQNLTRFCAINNVIMSPLSNTMVFALTLLPFSTLREAQSAARPSVYELLIHKHQFSPQSASNIASAIAHLRKPDRWDTTLLFLKKSGFSNLQLEKMVNSRPQFLSLDIDSIIKPRLKTFHAFGLSSSDITKIISVYPRILDPFFHDRLLRSLSTLKSLFGASGFSKILTKSCWFLIAADLDKSLVPNVEFLRKCGLSTEQIIQVARTRPRTLLCKPEDMKKLVDRANEMGIGRSSRNFIRDVGYSYKLIHGSWNLKVRIFRELGFTDDDIAATFRKRPSLFGFLEETLKHKVKTFRDMGFPDDDIATALRKYPRIFDYSEETLKRNVLCFKEMGFTDDDITTMFRKIPTLFGLSDRAWKRQVKKLGEIGLSDGEIAVVLRKSPNLFQLSERNLKLKFRALKGMGFSDDDIAAAFKKSPTVFNLSEENIKRTIEVLLENEKYSLSCIISNPECLTYSIEKRYKPRLRMLEMLEGKNMIQSWPPLSTLCWMTDHKFHEIYGAPFLDEIGDVSVVKSVSK